MNTPSPHSWSQPSKTDLASDVIASDATADQSTIDQSQRSTATGQKKTQRTLIQRLQQGWNNLNFRAKLILLLVGSATVPVIAVTQGLVVLNKGRALEDFQNALVVDGQSFTQEYVVWSVVDNQSKVKNLATVAKATKINFNMPETIAANQELLNEALKIENNPEFAETSKSFQILTDAQGQTVAQDIERFDSADSASNQGPVINRGYRSVNLPTGIALGNIPIVRKALSTKKPLAGMELLDRKQIKQLGLEQQVDSHLSDTGNANPDHPVLVSIAVQPIILNGQLIGAAIAGTLLNNHNDIANRFSEGYKIAINGVYAKNVQVMGKELNPNQMLEMPVSAEATEMVLKQGKAFTGKTTIRDQAFLTHYEPIFDHQHELQPDAAKPVGMVFVARPLAQAETGLKRQQIVSYVIGGSMWLLVGFIAFPVASSFSSPIRRLTKFAGEAATGRLRQRLDASEVVNRQDEIGILARELNDMVDSLGANEAQLRQESEQSRLLADITGAKTITQQELDDVFNQAVDQARTIVKADRVMVYRFLQDWTGYVAAESVATGLPIALSESLQGFTIPESLLADYQAGKVLSTPNIFQTEFPSHFLSLLKHLQTKANLVAPILSGDRLFGLLMVDHCKAAYYWQPSEVDFLKQLAAQLGLVLDRFTLLKETKSLAEEQRHRKEALQGRALELLKEVGPISKGNLTIQARVTEDEIGTIADSFNATVHNLRKIVTQVQAATNQVTEATSSSEASIQELSAEALQQAKEIAIVLEQVEEMANAVEAVASSAKQAKAAAQQAAQTVEEGEWAMNQTVNGIQTIQTTVTETAEKVKRLEESSEQISAVVELIKSFAKQTNMLALNASIEAVRGGGEGQNFVVIAKEVQQLAQRSAEATDEIKQVVAHIQTEINEVVTAMESGTKQVADGTRLVDATRLSLNKITAVSIEINQLVETIAQATVVQTQASETMVRTMKDVAALADKTSVEASQMSSSFEQLREVAEVLQEGVGQFKIS
ncbi:methyl-accepting chemotaxis protein [Kovacikia minuta CCNUW1]|uniref:methyl-accepting chemotaxis protein n=1 Tax=Kovacikia minuta TaxID=2931930 RepID=UPI001CCDCC7D|nr:methyl-accepting chemotaxis protein [Kovacikia minuta]UBF28097.1 methyl-accepting chemotaxis protein [Kovacikia minuta CCNUW1]